VNSLSAGFTSVLRPLALADVASVVALRNDPALNRFLSSQSLLSEAAHRSWFASQPNHDLNWVIIDAKGEIKGTIAIYHRTNDSAELGRFICVHPRLAGLAICQAIHIGFTECHLEKIYAWVHIENKSVQRIIEKLGFIPQPSMITPPLGQWMLDADSYQPHPCLLNID
jgi:RimJ/RimL family protein N-acetyltransferase